MNPLISIIIPVYNVQDYLEKCIHSIMNQTIQDIEIILVNDGSTDNSGEICDLYASKDSRIQVIHKINGGLSDARNIGIQYANGEFIGFVDSDDWVEDNMFEILYKLCIETESDISTCLIKGPSAEQEITSMNSLNIIAFDSKAALKQLYSGKILGFSVCDKLFRRSLFENIKFPIGRMYEDGAILYLLFYEANRIIFINFALYNYQHRENSITRRSFSEKRFDVVTNYLETYSFMEKKLPELCIHLNKSFFGSLRYIIVDMLMENNPKKNRTHINRATMLVKENVTKFLNNNTIPIQHKLLAITLAWTPWFAFLFYKIRFKKCKLKNVLSAGKI